MGCDIHMFVEKKVEDAWQPVKGPSPWYGRFDNEPKYVLNDWAYWHRNYELFALLADVRNYEEITPIDQPRGIPKDVSEMIKKKANRWGIDGHSHTYFTLSELKEVEPIRMRSVCEYMSSQTIPMLEVLAEGDPNSVRMVFWFDN